MKQKQKQKRWRCSNPHCVSHPTVEGPASMSIEIHIIGGPKPYLAINDVTGARGWLDLHKLRRMMAAAEREAKRYR